MVPDQRSRSPDDDSWQVLIVDDEDLARGRLRRLLLELQGQDGLPFFSVVEAPSALVAERMLASGDITLVLLDIQMPGASGLDLARRLQLRPSPPAIIFTTAHPQHAIAAFEVAATDFLPKPVTRDRLRIALRRVGATRLPPAVSTPGAAPSSVGGERYLAVTERGRVIRVPLASLLYLKAELRYVTLKTVERSYVLDDSLADLEQRLGSSVVRIHRNTVVAAHAIQSLQRDEAEDCWVVVVGAQGERLRVSRRLWGSVKDILASGGL